MSDSIRLALLKLAQAQEEIIRYLRERDEESMGDPRLDRAADLNYRAEEYLKR